MKPITIGKTGDGHNVTLDVGRLNASRLLLTSTSGGGKSWLLRKILELLSASTQTIVLDPEGEFSSLRELRDMLLVGPDGDIPADPRSAGLLARRIMEKHVSAVIDLYELTPTNRRAFVAEFCTALVNMPKDLWRPCFIAIDEAHEFAPNTKDKDYVSGEPVALLFSKGRKRGYCPIIATQRLSKLSMDVAAEAKNRFIGNTVLDVDQKRAADFLGWGKDRYPDLRDLSPPGREGEFFAVGPALNERGVVRFRAGLVETSHPKAGDGAVPEPPQPSKKIAAVLAELTDLPKQAEEEAQTVSALKAKNAALERQLRIVPQPKAVEVSSKREQIIIRNLRQGLENAMKVIAQITSKGFEKTTVDPQQIQKAVEAATAQVVKVVEADQAKKSAEFEKLRREASQLLGKLQKLLDKDTTVEVNVQHQEPFVVARTAPTAPPRSMNATHDESGLKPVERALLTAMAQHPEGLTKQQAIIYAGYKPSGDVSKAFARLAKEGWTQASQGRLVATESGVSVLGSYDPLPEGSALREKMLQDGSPLERGLLSVLFDAYPVAMAKSAIIEKAGYKASGDVSKAFAKFARLQWMVSEGRDVRASDVLFKE